MKASRNGKEQGDKTAAAKAYVDAQLNTIRKFGQDIRISEDKYKKIVQRVARAAS
jgi:hypothetical protein